MSDLKNLQLVASWVKGAKRVAVLTGAGVSVSAGIPDFRSPGGMYDTLRPELLTASSEQRSLMQYDPTAVVSWTIFRDNPFPYLELRRPFILGINQERTWKPTLSHFFFDTLNKRGVLSRLYTQNIDGLDFQTDIPSKKIVACHGSLGFASCEFCGTEYPMDAFCDKVKLNIKDIYATSESATPKESTHINCLNEACSRPGVKPSTVLYGRSLPESFFSAIQEDFPQNIDLLFVVGTSLTVGPANMLPHNVSSTCKRVIINYDEIDSQYLSSIGFETENGETSSKKDVFLQGKCDSIFLELAGVLDWKEDLYKAEARMAPESAMMLKQ